ncbi:12092_t:CDS:2 [Cetraspora pellucida]|uniref:12092_t:CDS:1 n=1 Tax=Cetraspora pellucida TaxID=1433469 RepID=A0A9N9E770_9GLOM|nr:12092_t:CDS:2 [Cetraspora pellucida]
MTAVVPKDITSTVPTDDRKMSNSEAKALKNTCSVLLSPLYAPVAKSMSVNNPIQHLESDNLIWEPRATNGGGSFQNNGTTIPTSIDVECDNSVVNEDPYQQALYSIAFAKPLVIPSAWSSLEDLTTPTTATTSSTATSRCSTPVTNGWSLIDHPAENFIPQRDSNSTLRSQLRWVVLLAILLTYLQTLLVRRSSNPTVISDVASEHSEKSTIELEKEQKKATLYKTEMCRNWEERGSCRYGNKCQFAHSDSELRKVTHHPKYKTEICKTFWQNGTCPYGKRCCFIHNDKSRLILCKRRNSADNLKNSSKNSKSKGLSKVGSDPALYGSYVNDSASSRTIQPVTSNLKGTTNSSSTESLRAFTDAYFSGPLVLPGSISNDPILNGEISTVHDESHPGSSSTNVNTTSANTRDDEDDEINVPPGYADKPLLLRELLTDDRTSTIYEFNSIQPDLYETKLDQNDHAQARRRASTTSCRLEKANVVNNTSNVVGNTILRERSVSMSVKQPTNLVSVVGQNRGRRLAIFRNLG